jgi:uncharacterized phage protein (TIGR02216 family)
MSARSDAKPESTFADRALAAGRLSEPSPFPWDEAMAFALGVLRWSPQDFWCATMRELCAAVDGVRGRPALDPARRPDLARLMHIFPDA